jgi:hypothetical protein
MFAYLPTDHCQLHSGLHQPKQLRPVFYDVKRGVVFVGQIGQPYAMEKQLRARKG